MKKKVALTAAAVALVGTLAVGGTLAWFTDTETATNVVTIGDLDVNWDENGKDITGNDTGLTLGTNDVPGAVFKKEAKIENKGTNDAYVRAEILYSVNGGPLTRDIPTGYEIVLGDTNKWVHDEDGYYYYTDKVCGSKNGLIDSDKETTLLLKEVKILSTATQGQIAGQEVKVVLKAEAIQADHVFGVEEGGKDKTYKNFEEFKAIFENKIEDAPNEPDDNIGTK